MDDHPLKSELQAYSESRTALFTRVVELYPIGSWVKFRGIVVGKVWQHRQAVPDYVGLILEHGHPVSEFVRNLERCDAPYWSKCGNCGVELNSDRFGRSCPHCEKDGYE